MNTQRKAWSNEELAQVITSLTTAVLSEPHPWQRAQIAAELREWLILAEKLQKSRRRRKPAESEMQP